MIYVDELEICESRNMRLGMMENLADKIRLLREGRGLTQTEFADELDTSQPTVARWERGASPKREALSKLAKLAGVSMEEFIGAPMRSEGTGDIPVVGYVGAGAAVFPFDDHAHGDGFATVDRPAFVRGRAVAVEVRGDSLVPTAEDGWRLIYTGDRTVLEDEVLNRLCVVKLLDGRMLVKRIFRGSEPQRYHLVSTNAPMIENAEVEWAARVTAIIPN